MTHVNRHRPRLCRECTAPMAGQSEVCWKCGAAWTEHPSAADEAPQLVGAQQAGGGAVGSPG